MASKPADRWLLVLGGFTLSALLALWISQAATLVLPFWDDWFMVPIVTGDLPVNARWLWSSWNQHRFPVVRLAAYGLYCATSYDIPLLALITTGVFIAAAAAFLWVLRRMRGYSAAVDLLVPLTQLNPGAMQNFVQPLQLGLAMGNLCCALFMAVAACRRRHTVWSILGIAALSLFLPLLGGGGLPLAALAALWLLFAGFGRHASGVTVAGRIAAVSGSLLAAVLIGLYFVDLPRTQAPPPVGWTTSLEAAGHVLSTALGGPAAATRTGPAAGFLLGGMALVVIGPLLHRGYHRPEDRLALLAQVVAIGSILAMALGIARARAGYGLLFCSEGRYVSLTSPLIAYLVISAHTLWSERPPARLLEALLACGVLLTWKLNWNLVAHDITQRQNLNRDIECLVAFRPSADILTDLTYPALTPAREVMHEGIQRLSAKKLTIWRRHPPLALDGLPDWFDLTGTVIHRFLPEGLAKSAQPAEFTRLSLKGRSLVAQSTLQPPALTLPPVTLDPRYLHVMRVEFRSRVSTTLRFYYTTTEQSSYTEGCTFRRPVECGDNCFYFFIPTHLRGGIQLHFGWEPGEFAITDITIRTLTRQDPR